MVQIAAQPLSALGNLQSAFGSFAAREERKRAEARARAARKSNRVGQIVGLAAGAAALSNPATAPYAPVFFAGGQFAGSKLAGGDPDPVNAAPAIFATAANVQANNQRLAEVSALQTIRDDRTRANEPLGLPTGQPPPATALDAGIGSPRPFQTATGALQIQQALRPPPPEQFSLAPGAARFQGREEIARNPAVEGGKKTDSQRFGRNFFIPNAGDPSTGDVFISKDGQNYVDKEGTKQSIPPGSFLIDSRISFDVHRGVTSQARAAQDLAKPPPPSRTGAAQKTGSKIDVFKAAKGGTGPISNLKAAWDGTVGAVIDYQFFPENAKNRSQINTFNQSIKASLLNSPRNPITEAQIVQKKILVDPDKFWQNSQESVQRMEQLKLFLQERRRGNLETLAEGGLEKKERGILQQKTNQITRALRWLDRPDQSGRERPFGGSGQPAPRIVEADLTAESVKSLTDAQAQTVDVSLLTDKSVMDALEARLDEIAKRLRSQ